MAVASDAKRRNRLIEGRFMQCPRCRVKNDVLRFVPMGIVEEFALETNPIYKCPECRWVFSPSLTIEELRALLTVSNSEQGESSD